MATDELADPQLEVNLNPHFLNLDTDYNRTEHHFFC